MKVLFFAVVFQLFLLAHLLPISSEPPSTELPGNSPSRNLPNGAAQPDSPPLPDLSKSGNSSPGTSAPPGPPGPPGPPAPPAPPAPPGFPGSFTDPNLSNEATLPDPQSSLDLSREVNSYPTTTLSSTPPPSELLSGSPNPNLPGGATLPGSSSLPDRSKNVDPPSGKP